MYSSIEHAAFISFIIVFFRKLHFFCQKSSYIDEFDSNLSLFQTLATINNHYLYLFQNNQRFNSFQYQEKLIISAEFASVDQRIRPIKFPHLNFS